MNETAVIGVWILAIAAFIAVLARWFVSKNSSDYIDRNDYTLRDFYTRKRR
jgi:uncharacterized membrane protein YdbT with pleckstrin-like domain